MLLKYGKGESVQRPQENEPSTEKGAPLVSHDLLQILQRLWATPEIRSAIETGQEAALNENFG